MEFENDGMNELMPDTESDISGVDSGSSQTVNDPDGLFNDIDTNNDGIILGNVPIENPVAGTNSDDVVSGTDANNFIVPGQGNDVVIAGNGNDLILAGSGFDTIDGGAGNDTAAFVGAGGVQVNLNTGVATFNGAPNGSVSITNVENVVGGAGDDLIIGNDIVNSVMGTPE